MSRTVTVADALADLDAIIRTVAPHEHPAGASRLVLTFAELGLDEDAATAGGFSASGLDRHAALVRQDPSLVGRPVVALAISRDLADEHAADVALPLLRHVVLHELAHAVLARADDASVDYDAAEYAAWLETSTATPSSPGREAAAHDRRWWLIFVYLAARAATIAPALVPVCTLRPAAKAYGYGFASPDEWIDAVRTDPDYLDVPLAEITRRDVPAITDLFDRTTTTTAGGSR
jgi:hypothetical protein